MKFISDAGGIHLDLESYGITAVQIEESVTNADSRDSLSGGNYESLAGSSTYAFSFSLWINSGNSVPVAGQDYNLLISTEAFAFYGTARFNSVSRIATFQAGILMQVQGFFQGAVNQYGAMIKTNPWMQSWSPAETIVDGHYLAGSVGAGIKQQLWNGPFYQQLDIDDEIAYFSQYYTSLISREIAAIGDTVTSILLYDLNTEIEQELRCSFNQTDSIAHDNVAGAKRIEFKDKVLTALLGTTSNRVALKIDNTGGSTAMLLDIFHWDVRKKII